MNQPESRNNPNNPPGLQAKALDCIALFLVVACLVVAAWLFNGLLAYWLPKVSVNLNQLKTQQKSLEDDLGRVKIHLVNAEDELPKHMEPGPEPSRWFHPYDHWKWDVKKKAHDQAQTIVDSLRDEKKNLNNKLEGVKDKIDQYRGSWITIIMGSLAWIWNNFTWIWNNFISPIFHFLLAFALLGLSFRVFFRYLLMKGKIGMVRV